MKVVFVFLTFIILIGVEVLKVYYIMPFPGSQHDETLTYAYFFHIYIIYFRIFGWIALLTSLIYVWGKTSLSSKIIIGITFAFYLFVFLLFNYFFVADRIFYQPSNKKFQLVSESKIEKKQLVLGVVLHGEAKAYPIELIGYHHQVCDTVGGEPVMITYCTVCRTGRVYSPIVDGKPEQFRLVGMDHFNAMFEDGTTKSWWRQVNGEAVVGPLKGKYLKEIPAEQMSLRAWLAQHADSKIMQPDSLHELGYKDLVFYDEGTLPSTLERRDSLSWNDKSWIVGLNNGGHARAYDWNDLLAKRVINDTLGGLPVLITLQRDSTSFHSWRRDTLTFAWHEVNEKLTDVNTNSEWNWSGECTSGKLSGKKLMHVQSYQEFWHSWKTFKPHTTRYKPVE